MSSRTPPRRQPAAGAPGTVALELSVLALMAATAFGFLRLFDTTSVLVPLMAAVLASEVVLGAGRRLRLPLVVTALVSLAVLVVVVANWTVPDTTARFLPTRSTLPALAEVARSGMEAFEELRAPAPAIQPFVLAGFVGLWLTTFMTDWAVVRLRLAFESVVPAAGLFLFCAILGSGRYQIASTVVFASAVTLYAIVQRNVNHLQRATWLAVERRRGIRTLAVGGVALGAVSVLAGLVVGPRLPGAGSEELWTWRGGGDGTRVVVSPFVTIESRLAEQADTELFRVTADEPAYWRTAGLDVYADGVWQIRGRFSREDGRLPGEQPSAGTVVYLQQRFELSGLAEIWLPAAYAPSRILEADGPITWHEGTGTLSVDRDRTESTGAVYTIESAVPRYTADELRAAADIVPPSITEDFLALPDDLSPRVVEAALQVTEGEATRYDKLLALQTWFLENFRYETSLSLRSGDPIEQFLDERVGFCQQFAGTFAVMARAIGAPARVAVGFTWGEADPESPGTFVVTGRHAHAWPEVWFEGLGWVPFEPTPGRGAPGAEGWTGRPASQDGDQGGALDAAGDAVAQEPVPLPDPSFEPMLPEDFLGGVPAEGGTTTSPSGDGGLFDTPPTPVLAVVGLAASWLVGVPLTDALLRLRRRARSRTAAERVELAWRRAAEELSVLGLRRAPSETRLEFSRRVAADRRVADEAPVELAQLATTARFHPAGVDERSAAEADHHVRTLARLLRKRVPGWRRYLRQVDPRLRLAALAGRS